MLTVLLIKKRLHGIWRSRGWKGATKFGHAGPIKIVISHSTSRIGPFYPEIMTWCDMSKTTSLPSDKNKIGTTKIWRWTPYLRSGKSGITCSSMRKSKRPFFPTNWTGDNFIPWKQERWGCGTTRRCGNWERPHQTSATPTFGTVLP